MGYWSVAMSVGRGQHAPSMHACLRAMQGKQIGSQLCHVLACGLPCLSKLATIRGTCELPRQRSLVLAAANFCLLLLLRLVSGEVLRCGLKRATGRAVGLRVFWSTLKQSPSTLKSLASATAARETGPALCSRNWEQRADADGAAAGTALT